MLVWIRRRRTHVFVGAVIDRLMPGKCGQLDLVLQRLVSHYARLSGDVVVHDGQTFSVVDVSNVDSARLAAAVNQR